MGAKTDNTADKKRIEELRRLLAYHSKLYYEKDEPVSYTHLRAHETD